MDRKVKYNAYLQIELMNYTLGTKNIVDRLISIVELHSFWKQGLFSFEIDSW